MRKLFVVLLPATLLVTASQACSSDEPVSSPSSGQTSSGAGGSSSGSSGSGPLIKCGTNTCKAGEFCCIGIAGSQCLTAAQTCPSGVALKCNGTSSCATGQVCCATIAGLAGGSAECKSACEGMTSAQVCETTAECKNGMPCAPLSQLFADPKTCGKPGAGFLDGGIPDVRFGG
jgi:hypothetical protein